jgi:hypothetical protein
MKPEVRFEQGNKRHWFPRDQVPHIDVLVSDFGFDPKKPFDILVTETPQSEVEALTALLVSKGFNPGDYETRVAPVESVETLTSGILGRVHKRAAAKIAMNYLAHQCGAQLARSVQLNDVRTFVRRDYGEVPPVHVSGNTFQVLRQGTEPARGHYVAVEMRPSGKILAQLSIYQQMRYLVQLSASPFTIGRPMVRSAHFFDTELSIIRPIAIPPWKIGMPLTPVPDEA